MQCECLMKTLNGVGKSTEMYVTPDGSRVLLLHYGARVLGLFPPAGGENFLWTHPSLASVESAGTFYQTAQWHNSGGDRTWVSPEIDVFFPKFPDTRTYRQPPQLDPGSYKIERLGGDFRLVNRFALTLSRSREKVELVISKSWSPALNPLRHEDAPYVSADLEYAGYTQRTSMQLKVAGARSLARLGLWNILQLPHGGEMLVPTRGRREPKVYFGRIARKNLTASRNLIRYRMRSRGIQKIGVRAVTSTGRVAYIYPSGKTWSLLVRNFIVNPSGEYVDVPWGSPEDTADFGYAVQACNVNGALGKFSELEYHVPAVGQGTGEICSDDASQIWAFRGPHHSIRTVARVLLSPAV